MTGLVVVRGNADAEATKLCIRGIIHHVGPSYFERVVNTTKREMAKHGVFGWSPRHDNMLFEVTPAPDPWRGEWSYKLRTVHDLGDGQLQVCEFYLPESQISKAREGHLSDEVS